MVPYRARHKVTKAMFHKIKIYNVYQKVTGGGKLNAAAGVFYVFLLVPDHHGTPHI